MVQWYSGVLVLFLSWSCTIWAENRLTRSIERTERYPQSGHDETINQQRLSIERLLHFRVELHHQETQVQRQWSSNRYANYLTPSLRFFLAQTREPLLNRMEYIEAHVDLSNPDEDIRAQAIRIVAFLNHHNRFAPNRHEIMNEYHITEFDLLLARSNLSRSFDSFANRYRYYDLRGNMLIKQRSARMPHFAADIYRAYVMTLALKPVLLHVPDDVQRAMSPVIADIPLAATRLLSKQINSR